MQQPWREPKRGHQQPGCLVDNVRAYEGCHGWIMLNEPGIAAYLDPRAAES
jgi:hypothetical protein